MKDSLLTFGIIAGSSVCFCSKAVFIKLAYRMGLDTVTVLALRMALALPFFALGAWRESKSEAAPLTGRDFLAMAGLGFVGYYLSSLINFLGLQFVSVGMERMVLYSYPSLVMLGSAVVLGQRVRAGVVGAMLLAYAGLALGYHGEAQHPVSEKTGLGVALVFGSAVTYAVFVLGSGQLVRRLGPVRFTSWVVGASCVYVLIHFCLTHRPAALLELTPAAYGCGLALATIGTVIPSYLMNLGLQRAGATTTSVVGMVGPLSTVALGWWLLGEKMDATQAAGFALTLAGGLLVSLVKKRE